MRRPDKSILIVGGAKEQRISKLQISNATLGCR